MENYVNLHNHAIYSALDAVCTPEQLIDKAIEYGHKAIANTEHGNFNSIPRFQMYALEKGIKPILGMEGYVVETLQRFDEKGKRIRDKNNHIVLLAMNKTGWDNLMKLNYLSNSDEEHFYYKPRISFKELFEHSEGIMLGTACLASPFANLLKRGEKEKAEELFQEFIVHFPDRMYAEVQLNEVSYDDFSINRVNIKPSPTNPCVVIAYENDYLPIINEYSTISDNINNLFAIKSCFTNNPHEKIVRLYRTLMINGETVDYQFLDRVP